MQINSLSFISSCRLFSLDIEFQFGGSFLEVFKTYYASPGLHGFLWEILFFKLVSRMEYQFSASFQCISLPFIFQTTILMALRRILLCFIKSLASWICRFMPFAKFGKFNSFISSSTFSISPSFSCCCWNPIKQVLGLSLYTSHRFQKLCSLFFFFFNWFPGSCLDWVIHCSLLIGLWFVLCAPFCC